MKNLARTVLKCIAGNYPEEKAKELLKWVSEIDPTGENLNQLMELVKDTIKALHDIPLEALKATLNMPKTDALHSTGMCHLINNNIQFLIKDKFKSLKELELKLEYLISMDDSLISHPSVEFCLASFITREFLQKSKEWEHHSGVEFYPVPYPSGTKLDTVNKYHSIHAHNWEGEYGELRVNLLKFLIAKEELCLSQQNQQK